MPLTDTLPTTMSGAIRPVASPGNPNAGFRAIGNIFENVTNVFNSLAEDKWQQEQQERQRVIWNRQDIEWEQRQSDLKDKNATEDVLDRVAGVGFAFQQGSELLAGGATLEQVSQLPGIGNLLELNDKAKLAQQQGSGSETLTLQTRALISRIMNENPDQRREIAEFLSERGINTLLGAQIQAERAAAEASRKAVAEGEQTFNKQVLNQAAEIGVAVFNDDGSLNQEKTIAQALPVLRAMTQASEDLKAAQAYATRQNADASTSNRMQQNANESINAASNMSLDASLGSILGRARVERNNVMGDVNLEQSFIMLGPQLQTIVDSTIQRQRTFLVSRGVDQKVLDDFDKQAEMYRKQFTDLFSGDTSISSSAKRAFDHLTTSTNMTTRDALATYNGLVTVFGRRAVEDMLQAEGGITSYLSEDQMEDFKNEVRRFANGQGRPSELAEFIVFGRNQTSLTPQEATKRLANAFRATSSVGKSYVQTGDTKAGEGFARVYSEVLSQAQDGISQASTTPSLLNATVALSVPEARAALERMHKDPTLQDQAALLTSASRAQSMKLFDLANERLSARLAGNPGISLRYNRSTAQYELTGTRRVDVPAVYFGSVTSVQANQGPNPEEQQLLQVLNRSLRFLDNTQKLDPVFEGVNRQEGLDFYTRRIVPEKMKINQGQDQTARDQFRDFQRDVESGQLLQGGTQMSESPFNLTSSFRVGGSVGDLITQAAERHGVPVALAHAVAHQESRGRQDARSPKGAIGVMQLMPNTARGLGVNPLDVRQNIEGGIRYLRSRYEKTGDWELALAAYNAGLGNVQKHNGVPPFEETRTYITRIRSILNR